MTIGTKMRCTDSPRHQKRHYRKYDGAGKAAQHADFSCSETETLVRCVPAGKVIGNGGDKKRGYVRAHVPAIRQQSHRMRKKPRSYFHHHHHASNGDDDPGTALTPRKITGKIMRMPKLGMIRLMHSG